MANIAHLTTVHPRGDTRIFLKQCRGLAAAGHKVHLVVADGQGAEESDGVHIIDAGHSRGRLERMVGATRRVLTRALEIDADVYHLHDPELMPAGLALKRRGKHVIYDSHEDLPQQILSKHYLPMVVRHPVSRATSFYEDFACRKFDTVVAATPVIRDKFACAGIDAVDINNFPLLGELETNISWRNKEREICYVGGISATRGIREIVAAMEHLRSDANLNLAGRFSEGHVREAVRQTPGWTKVNELGFQPRSGVRDILSRSIAGLVTLQPTSAYLDSLPVKMFEYMSAGLPVIASDFPLWREIIEGHECGICVDPLDPKAIASAIDRLVENPDMASRMGENGRNAVLERYNWGIEEKKLLSLYDRILSRP